MKKVFPILREALPITVMICFIPIVTDDIVLTVIYLGIIGATFTFRYEKRDWVFLVFGFFIMSVSEYFFVHTGVETFERRSLLRCMPLWLPVLWGYGFVAMRRAIVILEKE